MYPASRKKVSPKQPLRPSLRRLGLLLVPPRLQPPHQHPAGQQLDDAVQPEGQQGDAPGLGPRPEGNPGLHDVPQQAARSPGARAVLRRDSDANATSGLPLLSRNRAFECAGHRSQGYVDTLEERGQGQSIALRGRPAPLPAFVSAVGAALVACPHFPIRLLRTSAAVYNVCGTLPSPSTYQPQAPTGRREHGR